ncbi:MAG TPA: HD domain-containing protein [Candidatus Saccharimonadales bacterium]|nr:HD domain-containing protein [Candidatus Saccharimonadales bacterium]
MTNRSIEHYNPPIEARTDDLLILSRVVNRFMEVKRVTVREGRFETDGEHTLHLQFLAVAYAARYHPELDLGKVGLYGLVHDFIEAYAGDVNSLKATAEDIARKALVEKVALNRLENELGEAWPDFISLIKRYEEL